MIELELERSGSVHAAKRHKQSDWAAADRDVGLHL